MKKKDSPPRRGGEGTWKRKENNNNNNLFLLLVVVLCFLVGKTEAQCGCLQQNDVCTVAGEQLDCSFFVDYENVTVILSNSSNDWTLKLSNV